MLKTEPVMATVRATEQAAVRVPARVQERVQEKGPASAKGPVKLKATQPESVPRMGFLVRKPFAHRRSIRRPRRKRPAWRRTGTRGQGRAGGGR